MTRQLNIARVMHLLGRLAQPRCVASYFGVALAKYFHLLTVPVTPPRIDIEPINTCNLRCSHCQVPYWTKPVARLDADRFRLILDQLPGLLSIKLQGMGEPFLNRHLPELLRQSTVRHISVQVISNGTVLTDELVNQLLKLNRTHICFSVDGAIATTFESIRIGADYARVVGGIRELVRRRGSASSPQVSLATVVTQRNLAELSQMVELAHSLRVDSLFFQLVLTDWGKDTLANHNQGLRVDFEGPTTRDAVAKAMATAERLGVKLTVQQDDRYSRSNRCPWPWTRAFIAANGDVVPCCILADSDTIKMGNVFEQNFAEIWNSAAYREFRRRIRDHQLYDFCRGCYGE